MPLPSGRFFDIKSGPGVWRIVRSLFREAGERPILCSFKVSNVHGDEHRLFVKIFGVTRFPVYDTKESFVIKGRVMEIDDQPLENEPADGFRAMYEPGNRSGSIQIGIDFGLGWIDIAK